MVDAEGSEDVNDFLQRIRELGDKRDKEDEERTRKLEEEILQGRRERQARRAERARSISPTKDSPSNVSTPPSLYTSRNSPRLSRGLQASGNQSPEPAPSEKPRLNMASKVANKADPAEDIRKAESHLSGEADFSEKVTGSSSRPNSSSLGRAGTLSWQQRPTSRGSAGAKSRGLSVLATENNRLKSPRGTPDPESSPDTEITRNQIAQSLGSKDPSWFKQTQDRGLGSAAFRKNQDESKPDSWVAHGNLRLPGMSRESTAEPEKESSPRPEGIPPSSNSREGSMRGNSSWKQQYTSNASSSISSSAMPTRSSQRLDPPESNATMPILTDAIPSHDHVLPLTQSGRASPERLDRPASPTKGLGGFVQSAMLKRSDSQNKRWSAQAGSLSRGNSVVSNRSGYDDSRSLRGAPNPSRELIGSTLTRESSPLNTGRPRSSYGQAQTSTSIEGEKPVFSASADTHSNRDSDGFVKPELPEHSRASFKDAGQATSTLLDRFDGSSSSTPLKTADTKRWSPQKASWLESALNKPESPKPTTNASTQPSWMVDLGKSKNQRVGADQNKGSGFKEVTTGGLLRSPPMGAGYKTPGIGDLVSRPSSRVAGSGTSTPTSLTHTTSLPNPAKSEELLPEEARVGSPIETSQVSMEKLRPKKSEAHQTSDTIPQKPSKPSALESKLSPASTKSKPITPPKKDFRAGLKPRQEPGTTKSNEEAEFKNVFGKLKRTETKNYKAPDELKDNILRGKAGLSFTGGPKKTERRDDFKESILKKKEEMKIGPSAATSRKTSASGKQQPETPEALARMKSLSRSKSKTETRPLETQGTSESLDMPKSEEPGSPVSKSTLPQQVASKLAPVAQAEPKLNGKLAGRFNPALAELLSRGPPPTSGGGGQRNASPAGNEEGNRSAPGATTSDHEISSGSGQLTHMTKGRARGPKRKAPKAIVQDDTSQAMDQSPQSVEKKAPVPSLNAISTSKSAPQQPATLGNRDVPRLLGSTVINSKHEASSVAATKSETTAKKPVFIPNPNPPVTVAQPQNQGSPKSSQEPKVSIIAASKSPKIRKPSSQITQTSTPPLEAKPKKVADKKQSSPKVLGQDTLPNSSGEYQEKTLSTQASPTKDIPTVSVSNAAARWGNTIEKSLQRSQTPKSPVKLPTRFDEEAAHREAGLFDRQPKEPIGLGIRPLPIPPTNPMSSQMNLGLPSPPLQKFSPPTPTKKPALTTERASSNGLSNREQSAKPLSKSSSSGAAALLGKYFGELPPPTTQIDIDTPKILESRYQTDANKIKTLRKQIWQVMPDGRKNSLASQQEHILYEDSMYLCTHVFGSANGTRTTEVYLWYGDGVSSAAVEDAQLFSRKVAKENGSKLILLRQGKETPEFFQALGGIVITRKNRSRSYVLCGRRHVGQIAFDEVPLSSASLCSGFPYIVSASSGKLYLWKGAGSGADELGCARLIGMDLGVTGEIEEVDEGKELQWFWDAFPEKKPALDAAKLAEYWKTKPSQEKHATRLFSVEIEKRPKSSGTGGFAMWGRRGSTPGPTAESSFANIQEIHPYAQVDLEGDAVFVLDTFFEIFVVLPQTLSAAKPSPSLQNFRTALFFAQEYGILAVLEDDRPFVPKGTVVFTGAPEFMRTAFRKWESGSLRIEEPVTMSLSEALDAMKE